MVEKSGGSFFCVLNKGKEIYDKDVFRVSTLLAHKTVDDNCIGLLSTSCYEAADYIKGRLPFHCEMKKNQVN